MVVIISVKPPTANTRNTSTWTLGVLLRLRPFNQQPQPRLSRRLKNTRRRRKPRRRRKRRARRRRSPRKAKRQGSICAVFLLKLDHSKGILKLEPFSFSANKVSLPRCLQAPCDARRTFDLGYTRGTKLDYKKIVLKEQSQLTCNKSKPIETLQCSWNILNYGLLRQFCDANSKTFLKDTPTSLYG